MLDSVGGGIGGHEGLQRECEVSVRLAARKEGKPRQVMGRTAGRRVCAWRRMYTERRTARDGKQKTWLVQREGMWVLIVGVPCG